MNIDTALEKIYSLKQFHVKLGLDNTVQLLEHLRNPQKKIKMFHVAGSNGKGSTCSFLASILQENGYKVGLYTSPHFVKFNERIRINGTEISDYDIIDFLERNKSYIDKNKPTFFEITTALAFEYFNKSDVDFAIIETGLGGRLDATNVITPLASIITSISLEHSHILGKSIREIATEKAGIIKNGVPTFIGNIPQDAESEIEKIAIDRNSKLFKLIDSVKILNDRFEINLNNKIVEYSNIGLKGKHQLLNGSLAIITISKVLEIHDTQIFVNGLDNIIENTGIQGRYEKIGKFKNIIFDAAHNLEGIEIFLEEFKKEVKRYKNKTLIFGAMKDKNIKEMLEKLKPYFDKIFVTSTNYDRAASANEIKEIANANNIDVEVTKSAANLVYENLQNGNEESNLVVLGSIYLLGQIKLQLGEEI